MTKTIWTPERIKELQRLYAIWQMEKGYRKTIAAFLDMTPNQVSSALKRFCKEGKE